MTAKTKPSTQPSTVPRNRSSANPATSPAPKAKPAKKPQIGITSRSRNRPATSMATPAMIARTPRTMSAMTVSGESLGLQRVELALVDGAGVEQRLGVGDLVGRRGLRAGDLLDVLVLRGLHLPRLADLPFR